MSGSIRLSEKHGVNPSLMLCWFCGEADRIALLGRLPGDAEAPRQAVFDKVPCPKCADLMKQGVFFIQVRDGETDQHNPYRTGRLCVLRDEAVQRLVQPAELAADILKKRVRFVEQSVWNALGLPSDEK